MAGVGIVVAAAESAPDDEDAHDHVPPGRRGFLNEGKSGAFVLGRDFDAQRGARFEPIPQ